MAAIPNSRSYRTTGKKSGCSSTHQSSKGSTAQALHEQASGSWLWNGYRVMLVDGTTLLMPDTDNNQKTYPQQSAQKPGLGFPIVRLVGLVSLATGACVNYAIGPFQGKKTGETSLFSNLIQSLCKQDLLLADRYYTSYANISLLTRQGTALVFRQQSTVKSDFTLGQHLGAKDHIIRVKKPKKKPSGYQKQHGQNSLMSFPFESFLSKGPFMSQR